MKNSHQKFIIFFSWASAILMTTIILLLVGYLAWHGARTVNLSLIFGSTPPVEALLLRQQVFGGLFPAMAGTLLLIVLAMGMAFPVGVACGIYMVEYGRGLLKKGFDLFFDILAATPSIVVGLFGFSLVIVLHHRFQDLRPCLFISALSLSFLVLPYIIRTTEVALESVPAALRRTAPALGASKLQNIIHVLLPHAWPSMTSGIILAIGRCAEDTAVIMLTGAVAAAGLPRSLFEGFEALPFYIYYTSSQYSNAKELSTAYGAAIILLGICLILFSFAFWIKDRFAFSGELK